MTALIAQARSNFHRSLVQSGTLSMTANGVVSNADMSQRSSKYLARQIVHELGIDNLHTVRPKGQTSGKEFELAVSEFLRECLALLHHVRPANWTVESVGGSRNTYHLAAYTPYRHLDELARAVTRDRTLQTVLGNSYNISPDVLVLRDPLDDTALNALQPLVDATVATRSPVRASGKQVATPIVHAVISCKWTLRSDRAQNARSEALGLIRNRKGRAPHIAVVTAEPSPSRIASLALGTGDIDTVYHFALPELIAAAQSYESQSALAELMTLVDGDRLRDVSDLPIDLIA